ncbi:MAG: hypothetical protein ABIJ11_02525 [Elusimicrobiota bacterium]
MKKFITITLIAAVVAGLSLSGVAIAQEQKYAVTFAPLGLLYGAVHVNFDTAINKKTSFSSSLGKWILNLGDWSFSSFSSGFGYKMYPKAGALKGFYWGPRVEMDLLNVKYSYDYLGVHEEVIAFCTVFTVKLETVYRWIWDGFTLELGGNIGFASGEILMYTELDKQKYSFTGLNVSPVFNIGMAF